MKKSGLSFILAGILALTLSGCGGGTSGGSSSSGSTGSSGSGSGGTSTTNLAIKVSGLTGSSVTVQAQSNNTATVTATGDGTFYFSQNINDSGVSGATNAINVTVSAQPSNGESCLVEAPATGITLNSTVPVLCSIPVKPVAYPNIGAFSGTTATVVANPKIVPIFLSGATNENTDLVFEQQLVVSQYWGALSEYGVHNGVVESALYPTAPSALASGGVYDAEIKSAIEASNAWGAPVDSSTILVVVLPNGTAYLPDTTQGEPASARADHGQVSINGTNVQFVAIPGAANYEYVIAEYLVDAVTNPGGSGTDKAGSLGYVEMSPNPETYAQSFYHDPQSSADAHPIQEFVELGDACYGLAPAESDLTLSSGESLYAIWSNTAAAQAYSSGNYGYCQPAFGELVDYSGSQTSGTITATRFGHTFSDQALIVAPGSTAAVNVTAWGQYQGVNNTPGAWTLTVNPEIFYTSGASAPIDCSPGTPDYQGSLVPSACASAPVISVSPNGSTSVTNGDTFKVTITMPSTAEPGLWSILLSGTDGGTEQPILVTNASTWQ